MPTRKDKSDVSGPRVVSSRVVKDDIFRMISLPNRAIAIAWSLRGSGSPHTDTDKIIRVHSNIKRKLWGSLGFLTVAVSD